jgi:hypothetical protein
MLVRGCTQGRQSKPDVTSQTTVSVIDVKRERTDFELEFMIKVLPYFKTQPCAAPRVFNKLYSALEKELIDKVSC